MTKIPICIYGEEVLRKKTRYVKNYDKKLHKLIEDMFETMYEANGIGLAAPQVGILRKLIVVDTGEEGEKVALANPRIVWESEVTCSMKEGCLSIPGVEGEVIRPETVRVKANDPYSGEEVVVEATGLLARVFQHEIDHLNGVLFVDYLRGNERTQIERRLQELAAA